MTTQEGNKLIAEFMGWSKSPYPNLPNKMYRMENDDEVGFSIEHFKYDSSWDWLHPVVKKCFNLNGDSGFGLFDAADFYQDNIMNVWKSVTKFIQWYNSQTPNKTE